MPKKKDGLSLKDWIKFPFILIFVMAGILIVLPVWFCREWGLLAERFIREMNSGR